MSKAEQLAKAIKASRLYIFEAEMFYRYNH